MLIETGGAMPSTKQGAPVRRWYFLAILLLLAFAYINRERLFVRDPLGFVSRNGTREDGAQVYVNFRNEVLLENDHPPLYLNILQQGQPVGMPDTLKCIHYVACLASGDPVPQATAIPGARLEAMTPQQVRFRDGEGRQVLVHLR